MSNVSFIALSDFQGCEFSIKIAEAKNGPYVDSIYSLKFVYKK